MAKTAATSASTASGGLIVERRFTTPGVHPFDEIEWELRDAVIGDPSNPAFEQRGVEFPVSWSQNATNIVAQKYFRGGLDTPERERSVKQMISRVAGRIATWGREGGYFASEEGADAFEAELTHILLHQKAAFNSPVWFNVGWREGAEQCSACFILSVEDRMESILDWNTQEGIIFKGGSGSGINLSKIRGSMESLSKGGTASGPVSFMRGADSWAGAIKSGGGTRRAAKMVVLNADHPDVEDFIWCKAREEEKAAALRDAGFDMRLDSDAFASVQYQNANNSVRVTDEFMKAVADDADWDLVARTDGSVIKTVKARDLMNQIADAAWRCADPGLQYDSTIQRWHTDPNTGPITASNPCSEYLSIDDSACNLASLNLMKFRRDDGSFAVEEFEHAVDVVFLAQEIIVTPSSYPTEKIGDNARAFRQLGLGYANLGAYLMSNGVPYDSDEGRAIAAAITSLMTGRGYRKSAEVAAAMGPYDGYAENREPHNRVMRMHRDESLQIDDAACTDADLMAAARESWDDAVELGGEHGYRNAQATVLAPTGCLVPGSLVPTSRGLVRLRSLGDPVGSKWQDLDIEVATDEGPRQATKFFVNGFEQVASVETARGYRIQGTPQHRIKVVDESGEWVWRRLGELRPGDRVPLALNSLVGEPQEVPLPPLGELYWTADHRTRAPRSMSPELAELVGYFMGDGSLHAKGLRLCVSPDDQETVERLRTLAADLFGIDAHVRKTGGYIEVSLHSVPLTIWWEACGFAKHPPTPDHSGKGYQPHIPDAVLHSNDPAVYAAFVRGLFEADGNANHGYAYWSSANEAFVRDVQTLLLSLGHVTTHDVDASRGKLGGPVHRLRLLNAAAGARFVEEIGFISERKNAPLRDADHPQASRYDHVPVSRSLIDELAPENDRLRRTLLMAHRRHGAISRRAATALAERGESAELDQLLSFFYDEVAAVELLDDEPTYDLSVPDNVTYVANGFVSHNTISFLMDCDTTGIEPDFSLVKFKELVGGGQMTIVNQTVPMALETLGYSDQEIEQIEAHVNEKATIVGAPGLKDEHLPVFDVAVGERAISHMGHIKMMAAAQPFISGAISKCVTGDTLLATEQGLVRIGGLHHGEGADSFRSMELPVASLDGTRSTDAFYFGGERETIEVRLGSGHRVTGTPNHRLLVADSTGDLVWLRLDELEAGDQVATQYGDELWAREPARLADFVSSPPYGSQKLIHLPAAMSEELAFFLGAFAAEGHIARSVHSVRIANTDEGVITRLTESARALFGIEARVARAEGKCPSVELNSKTLVEFLDHLGCGDRSHNKRIPDALLRSPRSMVLAFLEGLSLDCYLPSSLPKWAICLASNNLLDDLQAVLTNLGVVHNRITKYNAEYDRSFDEVYAHGHHAQALIRELDFPELHKRLRAAEILAQEIGRGTADIVPGLNGRELYELIPRGSSGTSGRGSGHSREFSYLKDTRTQNVTWDSLERVATLPDVALPDWLETVLDRNLHFSPVTEIAAAGAREVYDVSVPVTHAFVGNGIVNHNTVNLPETASVDDIADAYTQGWSLGLKALAIYRDGSKTAQALRTDAEDEAADDAGAGEARPVRRKMPRERESITHKFSIAGHDGYITAGKYEDGSLGEIFLTDIGKEGSTLRGMMNAFATSVSIGLQYGVPLETLVRKFSYMRFAPEGITGNPEIPFAKSMPDYIMRWLASRFIDDVDQLEELGILTPAVRARKEAQQALFSEDTAAPAEEANGSGNGRAKGQSNGGTEPEPLADAAKAVPAAEALTDSPPVVPARLQGADLGPACEQCGGMMQRTGSCYTCSSCGLNTGCG